MRVRRARLDEKGSEPRQEILGREVRPLTTSPAFNEAIQLSSERSDFDFPLKQHLVPNPIAAVLRGQALSCGDPGADGLVNDRYKIIPQSYTSIGGRRLDALHHGAHSDPCLTEAVDERVAHAGQRTG